MEAMHIPDHFESYQGATVNNLVGEKINTVLCSENLSISSCKCSR